MMTLCNERILSVIKHLCQKAGVYGSLPMIVAMIAGFAGEQKPTGVLV